MTPRDPDVIDSVVIHCSQSDFGCQREVRRWHTNPDNPNGRFEDIGYHYVIGNGVPYIGAEYDPVYDGSLEIGRPLQFVGAHVKGHNATSIGIMLVGNRTFTCKQLLTLRTKVYFLRREFNIPEERVFGHRDLDPARTCPNMPTGRLREFLFAPRETEALKIMENLPTRRIA